MPTRPTRKKAAAKPPGDKERDAKAVARVAALLGRGRDGERLARGLVRRGVRSRAALRKPEVLRTLPKDSQLTVMYPPSLRWPLAEADALAAELVRRVEFCPPRRAACFRLPLHVVGSVRRRAAHVKDIDILIHVPPRVAPVAARLLDAVQLTPSKPGDRATILEQHTGGERHRSSVVRWSHAEEGYRDPRPAPRYAHVDFFLVIGAELPFALYHYTGSSTYNIRIRALAKKKGYLLNQYGLWQRAAPDKRVPGTERIKTERDIADFLGVTFREPPDRA